MTQPLKITLVAQSATGWHQQDLARAAAERGAEFEVLDIKSANELPAKAKRFGDVVIWRATSGLDTFSERASANFYFEDRPVLNKAVFELPFVTHKYYQQALISKYAPEVTGIPTYRAASAEKLARLLEKGKLAFPFIAKPNLGSKGKGIVVVENEAILATLQDHRSFVFQNFIQNSGDWRVIVVGGRALGVMRRIAKKGSFLNNISQGARSVDETRPATRQKVIDIALQVAAAFGLAYCGIDIIQDKKTKEFYFLEINTAPQWNGEFGFAAITKTDVAGEIIDLATQLGARKSTPTSELVQEYYDRYIMSSPSKTVHYASRLYLWTHDPRYRRMLESIEAEYLGADDAEAAQRLREIYEKEPYVRRSQVVARRDSMEKYPFLQTASRLLFKVLFARTLYGRDLRSAVSELVTDDQLLNLFTQLRQDHDAIRGLSTFAVNYFYLLKNYFADDLKKSNQVLLDPHFFANLMDEYEVQVAKQQMTQREAIRLQVYLVTHVIIGESQFYARRVTDPGYLTLLKKAEHIVREHYFALSLDTRIEFLVAAKLCGYESDLAPVILNEASYSLAPTGNFIIDQFNMAGEARHKRRFLTSEHRNVLYLMASTPFVSAAKKSLAKEAAVQPRVIGRLAEVAFPEYGLTGVLARVDSGAFFSTVHARNIQEQSDGGLTFELLGGYAAEVPSMTVRVEKFTKTEVKNTGGEYQLRYLVDLPVIIGGHRSLQAFTLSTRTKMACPILLGRTFLKKGYMIDVRTKF